MDRDRLAVAGRRQLHAAFEHARAEPHEGDAVAVLRVHVGLHLEDEAGDFLLLRADRRRLGRLRARGGRVIGERGDQLGRPEILERGAEIDRGEITVAIRFRVELRIARLRQLDLVAYVVGQDRLGVDLALEGAAVALRPADRPALQVQDTLERAAHADRPAHRRDIQREHVGDLVEQFERRAALAIDLVDEGDDRHRAQPAHLEQFARLRLDAARRVDHHHRRIDSGEGAIGILAEILVPRRVEQVEGHAVLLERHHRGGDGDAALLLDLHPVGTRTAVRPARLHLAGEMDRAADIEQFFGQRGLAGVRMRDDREGAAGGSHGEGFRDAGTGMRGRDERAGYDSASSVTRIAIRFAGLVAEIAREAGGIGDAVPRLDADEMRAGFGPDAEHRGVGEGDLQPGTGRSLIGHAVGVETVPDQRVVRKQIIAQVERAAVERRRARFRRDLPIGVDLAQRLRLVGGEDDAMRLLRAAARQRPGECRVEAEARRQRGIAGVGDRHIYRQRRPHDAERHLQPESEGIAGARLRRVGQHEGRAVRRLLRHREHHPPREAVLLHRIGAAVDADRLARRLADHREQQRRAAGPEGRVGIGHQLAAGGVLQRRQFRAERIDRRRKAIARDDDPVSHAGPRPASPPPRPPCRRSPSARHR